MTPERKKYLSKISLKEAFIRAQLKKCKDGAKLIKYNLKRTKELKSMKWLQKPSWERYIQQSIAANKRSFKKNKIEIVMLKHELERCKKSIPQEISSEKYCPRCGRKIEMKSCIQEK